MDALVIKEGDIMNGDVWERIRDLSTSDSCTRSTAIVFKKLSFRECPRTKFFKVPFLKIRTW